MNTFLKPIVDEFQNLQNRSIDIQLENIIYKFKVFLTHCSADLPAKASIMNMIQYNGYDACPLCLHPGKLIPNEKKSGSTVRYNFPHNVYGMRSTSETLEAMESLLNLPNQVKTTCNIYVQYLFLSYLSIFDVILPETY